MPLNPLDFQKSPLFPVRDTRHSALTNQDAQAMRLSAQTRNVIRDTAREVFGPAAKVRLFGSRLDDTARGGDLDLLVILPASLDDSRRKTLTFVARLQRQLGDQSIDVLLVDPLTQLQPVHQQALREGIPL
jgi:predicted nucleotidyltransferase